jgi:hypothetical protein
MLLWARANHRIGFVLTDYNASYIKTKTAFPLEREWKFAVSIAGLLRTFRKAGACEEDGRPLPLAETKQIVKKILRSKCRLSLCMSTSLSLRRSCDFF